MLVQFKDSADIDIHLITVPRGPVGDLINGVYSKNFTARIPHVKLMYKPGSFHMGVWYPQKTISKEHVIKIVSTMKITVGGVLHTGRVSTAQELAAYEQNCQKPHDFIVALAEVIKDGSREFFIYRDGERMEVSPLVKGMEFGAYHRFLVVFEPMAG